MAVTPASLRIGILVIAVSFAVGLCAQSRGRESHGVEEVHVDADGHVRVSENGHEVIITTEKGQVSVEPPVIAQDRRTVGWLVNFSNCCTSYPIPMSIVVYRGGSILRRIANGRAIFRWQFMKKGEQIAYLSDTVHGNLDPECRLVNVDSGRTIHKWSRGDGALPSWATAFAQDVGPTERTSK
jgi:hypothetical protein